MTGDTEQRFKNERTASGRCGVTLSAGVEGNIIADVMGEKEGVEVTKYPAMIRIDANDRLEFVMEEIADALAPARGFRRTLDTATGAGPPPVERGRLRGVREVRPGGGGRRHERVPDAHGGVLRAHPHVTDCAVRLMRPDEGRRLKAFVVPKDPSQPPGAVRRRLRDWLRGRLAAAKRPGSIALGPNLPRAAQGKVTEWTCPYP